MPPPAYTGPAPVVSGADYAMVVGQTPLRAPPPYTVPQMPYVGGGYTSAVPYYPPTPQVPAMAPWAFSPGWPYYPYGSPATIAVPNVVPEDSVNNTPGQDANGNANANGNREHGDTPATQN